MKKTIGFMVLVSFATASSGFAAGPIETSAKRAAIEPAQQSSTSPASNGRMMTWAGVGIIAGGIGLLAVANGPAKKSECRDILSGSRVIGRECEESTNGPLAWTGLGMALFGTVLTVAGVATDVQIRRSSIAVRVRF